MRYPSFRISTAVFSLISILAAACLLLSSCDQEYHDIEFKELSDVSFSGMKNGALQLSANARFFNPNNRNVKLKKADVDIYLDDKKVARLQPDGVIKIPKNDFFDIPVTVGIQLADRDVLSGLFSVLVKKQRKIRFKGYIVVKSWMIPFRVEVDHEEMIDF